MKEENLTPWFPAEVKPVHVGYYDAHYGYCAEQIPVAHARRFWNGDVWLSRENGAKAMFGNSLGEFDKWRGLRSKP